MRASRTALPQPAIRNRQPIALLAIALATFVIALVLRAAPHRDYPPFDDLYHLKRIRYSASHLPHVLDFDRDRGVSGLFCPWPPLYDLGCAVAVRLLGASTDAAIDARLRWFAPIGYSLFAAGLACAIARRGPLATRHLPLAAATAGAALASAPYLISISMTSSIDHHWLESMLVVPLVYAARERNARLLGVAIVAALFVQTALLAAVALAFAALFLFDRDRARYDVAIAFGLAAGVVTAYRVTRPDGYPDNAWFLGWPHAAALAAAAIACAIVATPFAKRQPTLARVVALACGAACLLPFAHTILRGAHFFGGDPWLSRIVEFQPMFRHFDRLGTDVANVSGGALLAFAVMRRERVLALFAIVYLALAVSSSRFLVPAIPLFALCGATAVAQARTQLRALALAALVVVPPLAYDAYALTQPTPSDNANRLIAARIAALPPGRVLAPWWVGHAIDVLGRHPVVLDNFGSMPDEPLFDDAERALARRDLGWCRAHGVRWLFDDRARIWPIE